MSFTAIAAVIGLISAAVSAYLATGSTVSNELTRQLNSKQLQVITSAANAIVKNESLMSALIGKEEKQIETALTSASRSDPHIAAILNRAAESYRNKASDLKNKISAKNEEINKLSNEATGTNTQIHGFIFGTGTDKDRAQSKLHSIQQNIESATLERDRLQREYENHANKGIDARGYGLGIDQNIRGGNK